MKREVSVIILTLNEEIHLRRCIENVKPWVRDIFVVDSFSTDGTVEIARELGAEVYQNKWLGLYALQFNWAIDNLPVKTKWVLRLDADEYLSQELIEEIGEKLEGLPEDVTGVIFKRRHIFQGRWIKRGVYPVKLLRLFRYGKGRCEQRLMDEHIELLEGRAVEFDGDFSDDNRRDSGWWTEKHNGYALREAVDLLDLEYGFLQPPSGCNKVVEKESGLVGQAAAKRAKKVRYARMPLFWRSFAYFCYRYFLRGGFWEGKEGFLWHFLQGWWYRTLVDAKVLELKRASGGDREKLVEVLRDKYGLLR